MKIMKSLEKHSGSQDFARTVARKWGDNMPIGIHFDDIERAAFLLTDKVYEDEVFDKPIGGFHGEFRKKGGDLP